MLLMATYLETARRSVPILLGVVVTRGLSALWSPGTGFPELTGKS